MGGEYVKYGLPEEITYCKKCTISNQRPTSSVEFKSKVTDKKKTIQFNKEGVCDACVAAEVKMNGIDWDQREKELIELCDKYRSKDGSFDCLVPGSGGKDSFYQAHTLKYKYGMNPLTVTWAPALYTDWGWRNHQKWIHSGFNNILIHPNGRTHRLLTRLAVENLYHPFQPFILGQKLLAPKIAQQYNISLIFYGENEAEYGNPVADNNQAKRSTSYFATDDFDQVYLGGVSVKDLKENYGVTDQDLFYYLPAREENIQERNIDVRYLGYYLKWHPQGAYYYSVEHGDFEASPERTQGTYSKYNGIDDKIDDLHYYTTYIKFGIGRATYDSSQEIRNEEIDREEGVALVKRFDGEFPDRFIKELYEYMSINQKQFPEAFSQFKHPEMNHEYFLDLGNKFRSPHLWNQNPDGQYVLKKPIWNA